METNATISAANPLLAERKLTLVQRIEAERRQLEALTDGIIRLQSYLTSAKFSNDPTVQVRDVLTRLQEALFDGCDARGL